MYEEGHHMAWTPTLLYRSLISKVMQNKPHAFFHKNRAVHIHLVPEQLMVLEEVYNLQREVLEHSCPAAPVLAGYRTCRMLDKSTS
jgi:hypothetical protein